jgi:hypothetical protein
MGLSDPEMTLGICTHAVDEDERAVANQFDRVLLPEVSEVVQ